MGKFNGPNADGGGPMTRLRMLWRRLRLAWTLARSPHLSTLPVLLTILDGRVYEGCTWAVRKTGLDVSLKGALNEQLRAEAIQWAKAWCREYGVQAHPWVLRIGVELAVGRLKGYL